MLHDALLLCTKKEMQACARLIAKCSLQQLLRNPVQEQL